MEPVTIVLSIIGTILAIVLLIGAVIFLGFVHLWIQSFLTGAGIGILDLLRMTLIKIDYGMHVRQKIALVQSGINVRTQEMEAHILSRGNLTRVVGAVIAAHKPAWICGGGGPRPSTWRAAMFSKRCE